MNNKIKKFLGGNVLPEITVVPNKLFLYTYYPLINSRYPFTGHSELRVSSPDYFRDMENGYVKRIEGTSARINKKMEDSGYNLVTNNCADATRCALEAILGKEMNPYFFTTPGDVLDFFKENFDVRKVKNNRKRRGQEIWYTNITPLLAEVIKNQLYKLIQENKKDRLKLLANARKWKHQYGGNLYDGTTKNTQQMNVVGYPLVDAASEGLTEYFNNNPNVAGMAIGAGLNGIDGNRRIVLNPNLTNRNARNSVYMNESYRHYFDANNTTLPALTNIQKNAYIGTPYEGLDKQIQRTEAARYLSGDPSHHLNDAQKAYLDKFDFIYPGGRLPEVTITGNKFADGEIHIKPENRGKFTALKERTGHSRKWKHENGGEIKYSDPLRRIIKKHLTGGKTTFGLKVGNFLNSLAGLTIINGTLSLIKTSADNKKIQADVEALKALNEYNALEVISLLQRLSLLEANLMYQLWAQNYLLGLTQDLPSDIVTKHLGYKRYSLNLASQQLNLKNQNSAIDALVKSLKAAQNADFWSSTILQGLGMIGNYLSNKKGSTT